MTFVPENGAHGSIGTEETRGFALLPTELRLQPRQHGGEAYIRGEDLYRAALHFLHPEEPVPEPETGEDTLIHPTVDTLRLRVMTYNVHSCIGMDGRARPKRIARVIDSCRADLVALQEVDVNRSRTRGDDQAERIAKMLGMHHAYYAVFDEDAERYGLAILSRYPIEHRQSGHLTSADSAKRREARGAMWVTVQTPMGPVHVVNTHFGLRRQERQRQIRELLSNEWLGAIPDDEPVILCGDLNAGPKSSICRALGETMDCVQDSLSGHRPKKTFLSVWPVRQLDHIFVSSHFSVESIDQPRDADSRVASDHLPICAELSYTGDVEHFREPVASTSSGHATPLSRRSQFDTTEAGSVK